mmetsp:Transcript_86263/g.252328  ORF Transcript_86263/g.252328 Transcript_86263/m.252328 type:complete len:213 (+) Transcript_86263:559-1197(+)
MDLRKPSAWLWTSAKPMVLASLASSSSAKEICWLLQPSSTLPPSSSSSSAEVLCRLLQPSSALLPSSPSSELDSGNLAGCLASSSLRSPLLLRAAMVSRSELLTSSSSLGPTLAAMAASISAALSKEWTKTASSSVLPRREELVRFRFRLPVVAHSSNGPLTLPPSLLGLVRFRSRLPAVAHSSDGMLTFPPSLLGLAGPPTSGSGRAGCLP